VASPPIETVFDDALRKILAACGLKLVLKEDDELPELSVEIREFHVGVEKKLVTGKNASRSEIEFTLNHMNGGLRTFSLGTEMDAKSIRHKTSSQLIDALSKLFVETLEGVPTIKDFGK
jgi:hypothetical protein